MAENLQLHSLISQLRVTFILNKGVIPSFLHEKIITEGTVNEEELDNYLENIVGDLQPKSMTLIDKKIMARRKVLIKTLDSKSDTPLSQAISEEYQFLRNAFKKVSVDKEKCRQILEGLRQKAAPLSEKEPKLWALYEEFAAFCTTYYLDDTLFKALRMNIKYAAVIQDADNRVTQVAENFSDEEYLNISEQLYRDYAATFKDNYFYYGILLGILNSICQNYNLAVPDYTSISWIKSETTVSEEISTAEQAEEKESAASPAPITDHTPPAPPSVSQAAKQEEAPEEFTDTLSEESIETEAEEKTAVIPKTELPETSSDNSVTPVSPVSDENVPSVPVPDHPAAPAKETPISPQPTPPAETKQKTPPRQKKKTGVVIMISVLIMILAGIGIYFFTQMKATSETTSPKETVSVPFYYPRISTDDKKISRNAVEASGESVLTDQKTSTVWHSPEAKGKELVFTLNRPQGALNGIAVYNGAVYKDSEWRSYGRIKAMTLSVNDTVFALLKLEDTKQAQIFDIEIPAQAQVKFKIEEVYQGENHAETALSEILFLQSDRKPASPAKTKTPSPTVKMEKQEPEARPVKPAIVKEKTQEPVLPQKEEVKKPEVAVAPQTPPAAETSTSKIEKAKKAFIKGNFAQAMEIFKQLAQNNNAEAQYYLGMMYEQGKGVNADQFEALIWYRRSAAAGYASADARLKELGY